MQSKRLWVLLMSLLMLLTIVPSVLAEALPASQTQALELVSLSPADGATGVATDAELSLKFNQAVEANPDFDINLTMFKVYIIKEPDVLFEIYGGPGNDLIFDPDDPAKVSIKIDAQEPWGGKLEAGHKYSVLITNDYIRSQNTKETFSGIFSGQNDPETDRYWRFETAAETEEPPPTQALELVSLSPADGATGVATDAELSLKFNQAVEANPDFDINLTMFKVYIIKEPDVLFEIYGGPGNDLIFDPDDPAKVSIKIDAQEPWGGKLEAGHKYSVLITNDYIRSQSTKETFSGIFSGQNDPATDRYWRFETAAETEEPPASQPLELVSQTPANGAQNVATDTEISLIFNQPVEVFPRNEDNFQIILSEDIDGDGISDVPVGEGSDFCNLMEVDPTNENKVILKINKLLEVNKRYAMVVLGAIRVRGSDQTNSFYSDQVFSGLGDLSVGNYSGWTFDTFVATGAAAEVSLSGETLLPIGKQTICSAVVKDAQGNVIRGENVTWSSSDLSKATVDETSGQVTAVAAGTVTITASVNSSPSVQGTLEIIVGEDSAYDLQITTDFRRYISDTGNRIDNNSVDFSAAFLNNGIVYGIRPVPYPVDDTLLYAFDLYGHELWHTALAPGSGLFDTGAIGSPVFGEDGTIFIQGQTYEYGDNGFTTHVFAIKPDGTLKWHQIINELGFRADPLLVGDQVIIGVEKGVYSLNMADGSQNWQYALTAEDLAQTADQYKVASSPLTDGRGNLYLTIQGIPVAIIDGKIQVLDLQGREKWHYITQETTDLNVKPPTFKSDGTLYITDDTCIVHTLNPVDGTEVTGDPLNGYAFAENAQSIISFQTGPEDNLYIVYEDKDYINWLTAINQQGTRNYSLQDARDISAIDEQGYVYYDQYVGGLAGGSAISAVSPYGNIAATIPPFGSSTCQYFTIQAEGNVLIAAKHASGNVIIAKIQRGIPETAVSVQIVEKDKQFGVGLEETLAVVAKNSQGDVMIASDLEWTSSNPEVIEVGDKGILKGKGLGSATLTVRVKGTEISDTATIEVVEKPSLPTTIELTSLDVDMTANDITLEVQEPYYFEAVVKDQYGQIMSEEKPKITAVGMPNYGNNILTPTAEGASTITATLNVDDRYYLTTQKSVTVVMSEERYSFLLPLEVVLNLPGSAKLTPVNQNSETMELVDVQWTSSEESVAVVDQQGNVTAVGYGSAEITATCGERSQKRTVSVVPTFGFEWDKSYGNMTKLVHDSQGNSYFGMRVVIGDNNEYYLVSLRPDGSENWRLSSEGSISQVYVGLNDTLYWLAKDSNGKYELFSGGTDQSVHWQVPLNKRDEFKNLLQAADGTLYLADTTNCPTLRAIDQNGTEKWSIEFPQGQLIGNIMLIGEHLLCTLPKNTSTSTKTEFLEIEDGGTEGIITNRYTLEFGFTPLAYSQGVLYGTSAVKNALNQTEPVMCALENEQVKWRCNINSDEIGGSSMENPLENLYFEGVSGADDGSFYAFNREGNLMWKKHYKDLSGNYMLPAENYEIDEEGNIYLPVHERVQSGYSWITGRNFIMKLSPEDGSVKQITRYDNDKYDDIQYIHLNGDAVYLEGGYLVKLSQQNDQVAVPTEVKLTGSQQSLIKGNTLQLTAEVYSQLGSVMAEEAVTWSSGNPNAVTVDANGLVTAINLGEGDILAVSVSHPEIKATYHLSVVAAGQHDVSTETLAEKTQKAIAYYQQTGVESDWIAFALGAVGEDINSSPYLSNGKSYLDTLRDRISTSDDDLGAITEYERSSMAILAGGFDPHNFGGMNLIEKIYNYRSLSQGNNAVMWALIALDAANAQVPESGKYNQDYLIAYLLQHKASEGWAISGSTPDTDMTSMALYALAPYKDRADVKPHVEAAVAWLKTVQNEKGSFNYSGQNIINTESTAQAILALTALGIDPQGTDLTRKDGNPVSALLQMQLSDGSFEHTKGAGTDGLATNQAVQALAALKDYKEQGKSTIYYHIPYTPATGDDAFPVITVSDLQGEVLSNLVVSEPSFSFKVIAQDEEDGLLSPSVKLNGTELVAGTDGTYTCTLSTGSNTLTVTATDTVGNTVEKSLSVTLGTSAAFTIERVGDEMFKNGQEARLKVKVSNQGETSQEAVLIVALYRTDGGNKMVNYAYIDKTIKVGDQEELCAGFPIPESGTYAIKGFVWNNMDEMGALMVEPVIVEVAES